jgi:hypothetical protein
MEWKAAEAVVEAQVLTESMLHVQGGVLQDEVLSRREEIGILLGKVLRYINTFVDLHIILNLSYVYS